MRADRAVLLRVLRDPAQILQLAPVELDLALRQLRRMKLLAHVGSRLKSAGLDGALGPVVRDQFESAATMAAARSRLALWELDRLSMVLQPGPQSPVLALKGSAYLLLGLPIATGRLLADVDLLVPEEHIDDTEQRLRAAGWQGTPLLEYDERYYREWTHEIPPLRHVEREMEVDVHHNILQRTARLKPDARLLLEAARQVEGRVLSTLSPVHMTLHSMTHLFYSGEPDDALRDLVDIDWLLRHFAARDAGFWNRLVQGARELDLMRPAWYALRYCERLLATSVPAAAWESMAEGAPPAPVRWLMDRLVPAALFARNPDRSERFAAFARTLLLARSHWIRMPPLLLASHLARKMMRRAASRPEAA